MTASLLGCAPMSEPKAQNLTKHHGEMSRAERRARHGHRGAAVWLTGLSGSGKSTLGYRLERLLTERGVFAYVLDGDNVRHGLNGDLGFSPEDRAENIRRIGEVTALFADAGAIVLSSFISPYRAGRQAIRERMPAGDFIEVHVAASLEVCEARDPKGLYKRARAGEIPSFTGISAPYEAPEDPELVVDTGELSVEEAASRVLSYLDAGGYLAGA